MPVFIVYIEKDRYLAEWLAAELKAHEVEVLPLRPIRAKARFISRMNKASADIFIWTAEAAKSQDMNEAKINAEIHRRYIAFDVDIAEGEKTPYAKLNANVGQLYERLRALGAAPVPVLPLDLISTSQLLLAVLAVFFIYLSFSVTPRGEIAPEPGKSFQNSSLHAKCPFVEEDCANECRYFAADDTCRN